MTNYEELSDTLTISGVTITMYAGIITKLSEIMKGFDGLDLIASDFKLQSDFVKILLTKYDDDGNPDGSYLNVFKLSPDEFNKVLSWGLEHYTVFISKSSMATIEKLKTMKETMDKAQKDL